MLCSTAEHVLAALRGLGVDNVLIELDGPEVPIMDGSAAPFVAAIEQAGIVTLAAPRRYIEVLKPVRVAKGDAYGELRPYDRGFRVEVEIDFDNPLIGRQTIATDIEPEAFRRDLARARTFGFMRDVSALVERGQGARRFVRKHCGDEREPRAQSRRPAFCRMNSCATRRSMRSAIWLWRARRCSAATVRCAAATAQPCRAGRPDVRRQRLAAGRGPTETPRRSIRGHADVATGLVAPAYGPDVS